MRSSDPNLTFPIVQALELKWVKSSICPALKSMITAIEHLRKVTRRNLFGFVGNYLRRIVTFLPRLERCITSHPIMRFKIMKSFLKSFPIYICCPTALIAGKFSIYYPYIMENKPKFKPNPKLRLMDQVRQSEIPSLFVWSACA